MVYIIVPCKFT